MSVIQRGLAIPWDVTFAPDGRMFVTERERDHILVYASGARGAPLLRTQSIPRVGGFQAGPMGLVLHPDFASNGRLYVCATRHVGEAPALQVLRYDVTGVGVGTRFSGRRVLLDTGGAGSVVTSGCRLRFGPDGMLWVATGQGRYARTAGDPTSLMGKVLRVTATGRVPADNPIMPGATTRSAVYTMGHRNPQGLDFHAPTGDPYLVEHGPERDDEINVLRAGRDYGWPNVTGSDGPGGAEDPVWSSGYPSVAPSGGGFAIGAAWGAWEGDFFVATLKENDLRRFRRSADESQLTQRSVLLDGVYGRLRSVTVAADGSLYLTTSDSESGEAVDEILRVRPIVP